MVRKTEIEIKDPIAGRQAAASGVLITARQHAQKLSLRAPEKSLGALSKALGVKLPRNPKTSATKSTRSALWLGPDEWLVIETGNADFAALAKLRVLHSAVDISHRNVSIEVSGPAAEALLSTGCPQDLHISSFPAGACSRTIFGKAEVILWRTAPEVFVVDCWRSFSEYVFNYLETGLRQPLSQNAI